MPNFSIGSRGVGTGEPCLVVAEAGVNHDNSLENARRLVDDAIKAGCDAVKFQTYKADRLAAHESPLYWQGEEKSQREAFEKSDKLPATHFAELLEYANERGIIGFSTPFDLDAVDLLEALKVPLYKIASADITYHGLLRRVAACGKPIMLSTGASTLHEIEEALEQINGLREETLAELPIPVVLLACTLCYPTKDEDANLRQIETLKSEFGTLVGLSDHTESTTLPAVAVALGACVVEKHFTSSRATEGGAPDHRMSMDPEMMGQLIENIRTTERALGTGEKRVLECEVTPRRLARRSVAAAKDIPEGTVIGPEMLTCLRPGDGVAPGLEHVFVGCKAQRRIMAGTLLREADLAV